MLAYWCRSLITTKWWNCVKDLIWYHVMPRVKLVSLQLMVKSRVWIGWNRWVRTRFAISSVHACGFHWPSFQRPVPMRRILPPTKWNSSQNININIIHSHRLCYKAYTWSTFIQSENWFWLQYIIMHTDWHKMLISHNQSAKPFLHYNDVIMGSMASQIICLTIVYSTVYSGTNQRKHKVPRHWPFWGEFTGDRWIPHTKGQYCGKCFHLMTSSCHHWRQS